VGSVLRIDLGPHPGPGTSVSGSLAAGLAVVAVWFASVALVPIAPAADFLTGRVVERQDDRLVPAPKILVTAWVDREVVGAARTDAEGLFRFPAPVAGRVRIQAERYGYLVVEAGGTPDPYIEADCSAACGPFDFVIERGAVVSGRVIDDLREPLANASVRLDREDDGRRPQQVRTDDRGRFRIPGLAAEDYELTASGPFRTLSQMGYETARIDLTVETGEERFVELTLAPTGRAYFQVSGVVTGIAPETGPARAVVLRPAGEFDRVRSGRASRVHSALDQTLRSVAKPPPAPGPPPARSR